MHGLQRQVNLSSNPSCVILGKWLTFSVLSFLRLGNKGGVVPSGTSGALSHGWCRQLLSVLQLTAYKRKKKKQGKSVRCRERCCTLAQQGEALAAKSEVPGSILSAHIVTGRE